MKIITGYVTDGSDWNWNDSYFEKLTHVNYAFAKVGNKSGFVEEKFKKAGDLLKLKKKYPSLRTALSVGGWGAGHFSEAAESEKGRRTFSDSALAILEKYDFDGLDMDWEYPTISGDGISSHPDDRNNFSLLLEQLRDDLNHLGQRNGKYYELTIAAGAQKGYLEGVEMERIIKVLDYVYLMNYDLGSVAYVTGHHAPLYFTNRSMDREDSSSSVEIFLRAGVPSSKLVFGFPFYGRAWTGVENLGDGLCRRVYGERGLYFDYGHIKNNMIGKDQYVSHWDNEAKAPWLFNGDTFVSYENPRSIEYKTSYIKTRELAGAMFWEYILDSDGELLEALAHGLA